MKLKVSMKVIKKLLPQLTAADGKDIIKNCHFHQFKHSQGYDIHWDGFTMLYNMLCQRSAKSNSRVRKIVCMIFYKLSMGYYMFAAAEIVQDVQSEVSYNGDDSRGATTFPNHRVLCEY